MSIKDGYGSGRYRTYCTGLVTATEKGCDVMKISGVRRLCGGDNHQCETEVRSKKS